MISNKIREMVRGASEDLTRQTPAVLIDGKLFVGCNSSDLQDFLARLNQFPATSLRYSQLRQLQLIPMGPEDDFVEVLPFSKVGDRTFKPMIVGLADVVII